MVAQRCCVGPVLQRIGESRAEKGDEQEDHGHEDEKDDEGVAHDVAGAKLKEAEDWKIQNGQDSRVLRRAE